MITHLPVTGLTQNAGLPTPFAASANLGEVWFWVPFGWWRVLAIGGAIFSLLLMVAFFDPRKLLPMALDLAVLWAAITNWPQPWLQPTA